MAAPWEKYQNKTAGPWDKYQAPGEAPVQTAQPGPTMGKQPPVNSVGGVLKEAASGLGEAAINIPASAGRMAGTIVDAVVHPWDTLSGVTGIAQGGIEKLIPGQQGLEGNFDNAVGFFKNRYGTSQGIHDAITKDPVGVAADMATILFGGGAAAARLPGAAGKLGQAASAAGKAIDPLTVAGQAAGGTMRAVKSAIPESFANRLTDMTLKQGTTLKPEIRRQNVKTAHEGGYLPTTQGVDKLTADIRAAENKIGSGIAAGDSALVRGKLDKAVSNIEALRAEANRSADPIKNNALIDAEIERLSTNPMVDASGEIPIGDLQRMKVEQGRTVKYQQKSGQPVDAFQVAIDKARIRGFKEELETQLFDVFPELSAANKNLGQKYQLQDVLERAANRIEQNHGVGIALPIKGGAGATIGGMLGGASGAALGAGIGTMVGIVEHPSVAPRLAQILYRSKKGKISLERARGIVDERLSRITAGLKDGAALGSYQSGRASEESKQEKKANP